MCVLRVSGRKFEPERYLARSTLKPYSVFRIGEPVVKSRPDRVHEESGFKVSVSRSSWDSLEGQVLDAVLFLKKHKRTLTRLQSCPEVEDIRLDFPIDLRIDRKKVFFQFEYFPPTLVSLAGALGCGLELSIYPRDLELLARARSSSRKRAQARNGRTARSRTGVGRANK